MSFTFKLLFANELRRVTIPQNGSSSSLSFSSFSSTVVQLFPSLTPGSFLLRWVDEDNDVITIASDDDLNEAVDYVRKAGREVLKATVIQTTPAAPAATPSAPMETEPSAPPAPAQEKQQQQQPAPEAQEEPEEPHYHHHRRHHGHHHRHHGPHHHHQHGHQQWQREESPPPLPETDEQGRPYHSGVTCDGCNRPLYGIRYKCAECHNFDLCEECEAKGTHPAEHVTLKIRVPTKVELYNPYGGRIHGGGRRECPWFGGFGAPWQQHGFAHPWHRGPWQHGAFPPPPPPHPHVQQQQQQQQHPWGHWGGRSHCRRGWWNKHHEGAGEASSSSSFSSSTSSASASTSSPSASSASTSVSVEPLIQLLQQQQQQQSASEEGYEDRLQILSSMGFYDRETNLRLLKEGNGSLEDVITKLTELTF